MGLEDGDKIILGILFLETVQSDFHCGGMVGVIIKYFPSFLSFSFIFGTTPNTFEFSDSLQNYIFFNL